MNPSQKKIFIEFYKDESLGKLKFIIDTDFIEQVNYKLSLIWRKNIFFL